MKVSIFEKQYPSKLCRLIITVNSCKQNTDEWIQMYILSFNLKEQLMLLLQNVNEVKQSTPALSSVFTMCDSTRQNGLVTTLKIKSILKFFCILFLEAELLNDTLSSKIKEVNIHTEEVESMVEMENERRKEEALELRQRMEREKKELQEYIEKDNAAILEKVENESKALKDRIDQDSEVIKTKMAMEKEERLKENKALQIQLQEETDKVKEILDCESNSIRQQLTFQEQKVQEQLDKENATREAVTKALQKKMEADKQVKTMAMTHCTKFLFYFIEFCSRNNNL